MKTHIYKIKKKYFNNFYDRSIAFSSLSFFMNLSVGIVKLFYGIYDSSIWFMILSGYDIILCIAKGYILILSKSLHNNELKIQNYHHIGFFIFFLGLSYFVLCIWMLIFDEKRMYPSYLLYGVTAFAFYKIGSAIYGMVIVKKQENRLLSMLKMIHFMDACVSIVTIQCAILVMKHSDHAIDSSAILGMTISLIFMAIGYHMKRKYKIHIHKKRDII